MDFQSDISPGETPQNDNHLQPDSEPSNEDKMWALLAHLSILVFSVFGPLIIWLVKKDTSPFVDDQAKEALNFQLAVLIVILVSSATCILLPVGIVALIGGIVYGIIGGLEANKGILYRYPYTFRMIK